MSGATTRLVRRVKSGDSITLDGPGKVTFSRQSGVSRAIIEAPRTTNVSHLEAVPPPKDFLKRFRGNQR